MASVKATLSGSARRRFSPIPGNQVRGDKPAREALVDALARDAQAVLLVLDGRAWR